LRVENLAGDTPITLKLAGTMKDGETGLRITPRVQGLVADLYTRDGQLVASGKSIIDMRALEAGSYLLNVHTADRSAVEENLKFAIAVDAPIQGWTHPVPDRDRIMGGDGDDKIVGESGTDRVLGEAMEVHDFGPGESLEAPEQDERSNIPPSGAPVDAWIAIEDANLRVAIAEQLGYAVTRAYNGSFIIHVPDGNPRTDLAVSNGAAYSQRILASSLAEMQMLDASSRNITRLGGLEYALNLQTLNLANNAIADLTSDGALFQLQPGTITSGDAVGFPVGMGQLQNLALDFNPLTNLDPLGNFGALERLSFDGLNTQALLTQVPDLRWVTPTGDRGLK